MDDEFDGTERVDIMDVWNIATWNVTSLTGKDMEAVEEMRKYDITLLGLSETKIVGQGIRRLGNKYRLYYSGVEAGNRAKEGVGIIMTEDLNRRIIGWNPISSRIISLTIELRDKITLIQIYAPVEGTEEDKMKEFYAVLQRALDEARDISDKVVIMGDWNARVGNDTSRGMGTLGSYGERENNRNGIKMLEFCIANNLIIGNTHWFQPTEHRFTFVADERGARSIIDYIVYCQEMENTIKEVRVRREAELNTNHRLVMAKIGEPIEVEEKRAEYRRINISRLRDEEAKMEYAKRTDEELQIQGRKDLTPESRWEIFKKTILRVACEICGYSRINKGMKRTRWWTEEVRSAVKQKKLAWKRYQQTNMREDKEIYDRLNKQAKDTVKKAKKKSWEEFGEEINKGFKNRGRKFWTRIKSLRGKGKHDLSGIKDRNNKLLIRTTEISERWRQFLSEKFDNEEDNREDEKKELIANRLEEIDEHTISRHEVVNAISRIKTGKACGEDDIEPEMIKWLGNIGIDWMWRIFMEAEKENRIPNDWDNNLLLPIYKKGDKTDCENYRIICLSSIVYKTYTRIIEQKIRTCIENKLEEEQAAFRANRQTSDNVYILRDLIEKRMATGEEMILAFIDLQAAFDTVQRSVIKECLNKLEVPAKLINLTNSVYKNAKARIQVNGTRSNDLLMKKGIKQGDSLSPLLFIIVMDRLLKNIRAKYPTLKTTIGYRRLIPIQVDALMYADDIVLIADNKQKMQKLLKAWIEEIENLQMKVNISKSKVMIYNKATNDEEYTFYYQGRTFEEVSTMEYLGSTFTNDGKFDLEIASRTGKANRAYYALNKTIFGKKEVSRENKLIIYNTIVSPIMLYSSETWTIQRNHRSKLTAAEMKVLRKIANKTKFDHIKNENIRSTLQQESVCTKIENKQLEWFGHLNRMSAERLPRKIMEARQTKRRRRGRPRLTWMEQIVKVGQIRGKTLGEMKEYAKDRKKWKTWIRETSIDSPTPA